MAACAVLVAATLAGSPPALAQAGAAAASSSSDRPAADACRIRWEIAPLPVSAASDTASPAATPGMAPMAGRPSAEPGFSVRLRFAADGRRSTHLRLSGGWAPVLGNAGDGERLLPVPEDPQLRRVRHGPDDWVDLRWEFRPSQAAPAGGALIQPGWYAFTGGTVLPWIDELAPQAALPVCLSLALPAGSGRAFSSFGNAADGSSAWQVNTSAGQWQRALFAAGAWQQRQLTVPGHALTVAMPERVPFAFDIDTLANATASNLAALRQPWGLPGDSAPLLLLVLPGSSAAAGLALHRAMVLQLPPTLPVPSERLDELVAAQWHRAWLPERLGPLAHAGRGDAALRAWFTEGLADFLTHRWLLREGRWSAGDYAAALNRKIAAYQALPEASADNLRVATGRAGTEALAVLPAVRGELLAHTWHLALRRAGHPGLEPVLYGLALPTAQARSEGPISSPLATHRLLAALRKPLGDQALRALTRYVDEGQRFEFGAQTLGPCFAARDEAHLPRYAPQDGGLAAADCQAWLRTDPSSLRDGWVAAAGQDAAPTRAASATAAVAGVGAGAAMPDSAMPTRAPHNGAPGAAAMTAAAAGVGTAAAATAATRQLCRTVAAPKGARGAAAKPKTVCRLVAATPPQASAQGTRVASGRAKPARAEKPVNRSSAAAGSRTGAKPGTGRAETRGRAVAGSGAAAKKSSAATQPAAAKPKAAGSAQTGQGRSTGAAKPAPRPAAAR